MELGPDNFEFSKVLNASNNFENITPHKIAVIAFIREYGLLKIQDKETMDYNMSPKYKKDFCILALKLIQCPDMEFKDLEAILTDGRYNILNTHLRNFCVRLQNICVNGIGALVDCVTSAVDKLMFEQTETSPCVITRCSVLGFYLRRMMLHLEKLTFMQVVSLYKSFCLYYQRGRPGTMMRSLSKEKLNNMEAMSSTLCASPIPCDEPKQHELSLRMNILDRDDCLEECQWSRKQAELFTSQQANLLEINESKAMPPRTLQKSIAQIMNDLPEYPDVHFLSFMNCIRAREFCGAQDSLYNCFDRTVFNNAVGDRNRNFRYAALNRAAMYLHFGYNAMAMEGVGESQARAQEAGDAPCLGHASAWGAAAGGRHRRYDLLAKVPAAPRPLATVAQLTAQHRAVNGATPADVFDILLQGDTINYSHSMIELILSGLANSGALWSLYGNTEMAALCCQLLLNLNTKSKVGSSSVWHWTDSTAAALAGIAWITAWRGDHTIMPAVVSRHTAKAIQIVSCRSQATLALYAGKWEEADQRISQLASYDRWESQLLKAEMYFLKGDATESLESLQDVLDYCKTEDDSLYFMSLKLKAMILQSQVQHTFSRVHSANIMLLNEALSLAKKYYLHYLAATVEMHIANVQLHMGCAKSALRLVKRVLPVIMAHGSCYDMARASLLYTKCRVASAPSSGEARTLVLTSCCEALETVKRYLAKVGAQALLLQTWYLQAQLYNEIGNHSARNQCAWTYRQLEAENPVDVSNIQIMMY